jgi:hypothetical protein
MSSGISPRRWGLSANRVLLALAAMMLAALWWVDPGELQLPLCGMYRMTGLHCPGCGATRATHALLHARLGEAMHQNVLFVLCLPVAGYAAISEWRRRRTGRPLPGDLSRRSTLFVLIAVLAIVFFVLRNLPWYPLTLLAPPLPP